MGCLVRHYREWFQASHAEERKYPLFGTRLDDKTIGVGGSCPKPLHRVPSEMIVRDRIRETSVRVLLIRKHTVHNLTIERSVGERPPTNERVMQNTDGGRVSHAPFVAVNRLRSIRETILREEGPLLPTGAAPVDSGRVDTNLGFEERGGIWEIEESE
jgi:hypothetical protein